jgi:hypothetical protein
VSRIFRAIFLAAALLSAQQAGLAHALWHAGAERSPDEGQAQLCQLHAVLGTVCGAVDVTGASACPLEIQESVPEALCVRCASLPAPTPASRGPPALL